MKNSFISLTPNPPEGFKNITPTKHALLGGRVALYANPSEDVTSLLDNFTERVQGIIITQKELFSFTQLGPALWHMGVTKPMLADLASVAASYLDILSFGLSALNQNEHLKLELADSKNRESKLTENYNVNVQRLGKKVEQLHEEMSVGKRAEEPVRGRAQRFAVEGDAGPAPRQSALHLFELCRDP